MLFYDSKTYDEMLGHIDEATLGSAASCIAQCTGCMCNCRCSCSGGKNCDIEWEVI